MRQLSKVKGGIVLRAILVASIALMVACGRQSSHGDDEEWMLNARATIAALEMEYAYDFYDSESSSSTMHFDNAISECEHVLKINANFNDCNMIIGEANWRLGRYASAEKYLRKALFYEIDDAKKKGDIGNSCKEELASAFMIYSNIVENGGRALSSEALVEYIEHYFSVCGEMELRLRKLE